MVLALLPDFSAQWGWLELETGPGSSETGFRAQKRVLEPRTELERWGKGSKIGYEGKKSSFYGFGPPTRFFRPVGVVGARNWARELGNGLSSPETSSRAQN